jgi:chromosome segregation ATPase
LAGDDLTREQVSIERLVASIDNQIAALNFELEAERTRMRNERARVETAIEEFHRLTAELAKLNTSPWWRRRTG